MGSQCTSLRGLELAFLHWQDNEQEWAWHRATSTNKVYVHPSSKCKGAKPRHKCKGEVIMEVKWKAGLKEKMEMKVEKWKYLEDWVILHRIVEKRKKSASGSKKKKSSKLYQYIM